jgi:hypothetical protein
MTKQVLYKYLGTNGVIVSPIHLEDIYYVRNIRLTADPGKMLTRDNKTFIAQTIIPEEELEEWQEVMVKQQ